MAPQRSSANLIRALYNLSREHDTKKRQTLLNAGLIEMIKWFSLAARKIAEGKMKLPKQTQKFMDRHKTEIRKLASPMVDADTKRQLILKPGGGGFFGGVIIRTLIRWDGNKILRRFTKRSRSPKKKTQKKKKSKKNKKKKSKKTKKSHKRRPRKIKINDRFVTVRVKKPRKPTPSPPLNTSAHLLGSRTPSPLLISSPLSTPPSSLRRIGERLSSQKKTPSPTLARFSPLSSPEESPLLRTARLHGFEAALNQAGVSQPFRPSSPPDSALVRTAKQHGFEAAMRQAGATYNQPFRIHNRGPNLKVTKRKLNL